MKTLQVLRPTLMSLALIASSTPAMADRPMMGDNDYQHMMERGWGGMMGGPGMGMMGGSGMMGGGAYTVLDLNEEQRGKVNAIQKELRQRQWELMEKMQETMERVQKLWRAEKRDPKEIARAHEPMYKLHQQMIELSVEADNRIEALLTKEQREELQRYRRRGWGMMGPGMMWGN